MPDPHKWIQDYLEDYSMDMQVAVNGHYRDYCRNREDLRKDPGLIPVPAEFLRELRPHLEEGAQETLHASRAGITEFGDATPVPASEVARALRALALTEECEELIHKAVRARGETSLSELKRRKERRQQSEAPPHPSKITGDGRHKDYEELTGLLSASSEVVALLVGAASASLDADHPFIQNGIRLLRKIDAKLSKELKEN